MQRADINIGSEQYACIRVVYDVGLLQKIDAAYYSCSPSGITLLDWMDLNGAESWMPALTAHLGDDTFAISPA